jgi:D-alanine--poly(phosphoribitol) ligase subunit 2
MIEEEAILQELQKIFTEQLLIDVSSADTNLFETGALDSLSLVELLLQLEKRFGFAVPLQELELEDFSSITRIARLVTMWKIAPERQTA